MRVLIIYYSRSGHTAHLAHVLAEKMVARGHEVTSEAIEVARHWNKWLLPIPLLPLLPFLPLYLISKSFRRVWHRVYFQPKQRIRPLANLDVAGFDLILLGTPKWLYLSYPVARWLDTVHGLQGTRVATFATFCGPPLPVFEIAMLFEPLVTRIRARGAVHIDYLALSSDFHEYFFFNEMRTVFRFISRKVFHRALSDFTLHGELGRTEVDRFLAKLVEN